MCQIEQVKWYVWLNAMEKVNAEWHFSFLSNVIIVSFYISGGRIGLNMFFSHKRWTNKTDVICYFCSLTFVWNPFNCSTSEESSLKLLSQPNTTRVHPALITSKSLGNRSRMQAKEGPELSSKSPLCTQSSAARALTETRDHLKMYKNRKSAAQRS